MPVKPPDVRQVLVHAFGLPRAGLDVCPCVIGDGGLSPAELADRLDDDASTVKTTSTNSSSSACWRSPNSPGKPAAS